MIEFRLYTFCFMHHVLCLFKFAALHNELYEFVSYSAQSSQVSLLKNIILESKYLCIYEDSFGAKIVREDCAPKSSISIGINIHKLLLVIAIWTSKSRALGVLCLIIIFIPGIYSQVIAEWLGSILKRAAFLLSRIYYRRRQFLVVGSTGSCHTE